jgi:hypothetical protein
MFLKMRKCCYHNITHEVKQNGWDAFTFIQHSTSTPHVSILISVRAEAGSMEGKLCIYPSIEINIVCPTKRRRKKNNSEEKRSMVTFKSMIKLLIHSL